jgi:predicted  nucleic acid-binding Zn-ribbon protein
MLEVAFKWLASLNLKEAAGLLGSFLGALIFSFVHRAWKSSEKERQKAYADIEKRAKLEAEEASTRLEAPLRDGLSGAALVEEMEARLARTEWSLDEARKRVGQLEKELQNVGADAAKLAQALTTERHQNERALHQMRDRVAQLERELVAAQKMAQAAIDELEAQKHAGASSHTSEVMATTPLRPPPLPPLKRGV